MPDRVDDGQHYLAQGEADESYQPIIVEDSVLEILICRRDFPRLYLLLQGPFDDLSRSSDRSLSLHSIPHTPQNDGRLSPTG